MSEVLLFHHVQGLTDGVLAFAERLRDGGHTVHTPDLFDGRIFGSIDDGLVYAKSIGFQQLEDAGAAAADGLPADLFYLGFSMGVLPAQRLTQTRAGARGGVFLHSTLPASEYGGWPSGVPAQIHAMDADPFFVDDGDIDFARELVASTDEVELFLYPGREHLFTDSSLPAYDAEAAAVALERVLGFLAE